MRRQQRTQTLAKPPPDGYAWEVEEPPVTEDDVAFYDFFENVLMSLSPVTRDGSLELGDRGRRLWHAPAWGDRR